MPDHLISFWGVLRALVVVAYTRLFPIWYGYCFVSIDQLTVCWELHFVLGNDVPADVIGRQRNQAFT